MDERACERNIKEAVKWPMANEEGNESDQYNEEIVYGGVLILEYRNSVVVVLI